jgi:hypothetical protein
VKKSGEYLRIFFYSRCHHLLSLCKFNPEIVGESKFFYYDETNRNDNDDGIEKFGGCYL